MSKIKISEWQERLTESVIDRLKTGKSWQSAFSGLAHGLPMSVASGKPYQGGNMAWLSVIASINGFSSPKWGTFKAWKALGGMVKKGEKSAQIVSYNPVFDKHEKDEQGNPKLKYMSLRYFNVFNLDQIDIDSDKLDDAPDGHELIQNCDINLMDYFMSDGAPLLDVGRPCYIPSRDIVLLPENWVNEFGESTVAHEIIHSTGHGSRLNRDGVTQSNKFGSHEYSFEELVAELGSLFVLSSLNGLNDQIEDNSVAYIESWLKVLKDNPDWLWEAAKHASKAHEFVLDKLNQVQHLKVANIAK